MHVADPSCATCHNLIDPIGFGFEKFDAIGARREKLKLSFDGGARSRRATGKTVELDLDTTGNVAGIPNSAFQSPDRLGAVLAQTPQCQECVVKQYFRYISGRIETPAERAARTAQYKFPASLAAEIPTSPLITTTPTNDGRGRAYGVFGQDQMSFGERTTLTAGLLVNKDQYFGEVFTPAGTKRTKKIIDFDWSQELQPRLGIAYVPSVQRGDKLYANFGRYYNTDNKSLGRAGSPTRIFTTRATFDAAGNLIREVPQANTQTKTIDSGLDPQYTDELLAGYARPFGVAWSAEVWARYRRTVREARRSEVIGARSIECCAAEASRTHPDRR